MNVDSDDWELLTLAAVGMAMREASAYIVLAINLLRNTSLEFNPEPLNVWAASLADAAHEFDPSDQRIPQPQEPTP
jgi:hypothetical protein